MQARGTNVEHTPRRAGVICDNRQMGIMGGMTKDVQTSQSVQADANRAAIGRVLNNVNYGSELAGHRCGASRCIVAEGGDPLNSAERAFVVDWLTD